MTDQYRAAPELWAAAEKWGTNSCSPGSIVQDNITFQLQGNSAPKEIIRIDSEGFHYRGQLIEDAGEAHRLLIEFMRQSNEMRHISPPTPEATND